MLVTKANFDESIASIQSMRGSWMALDTETTGLDPYKGDRMFSLIICGMQGGFYFNFNHYPNTPQDEVLGQEHIHRLRREVFIYPGNWFIHNSLFDLSILAASDIEIAGNVHCTWAGGRLLHNNLPSYKLEDLGRKYFGEGKYGNLESYCESHKLFNMIQMQDGSKEKRYMFHKIPLEVMVPYGLQDGFLCLKIGNHQIAGFHQMDARRPKGSPAIWNVVTNEWQISKTVHKITHKGISVDRDFCKEAYKHFKEEYIAATDEYKRITGKSAIVDSAGSFKSDFAAINYPLPTTDAGNASLTDEILKSIDHPLAKCIRTYRKAYKKAHTYFEAFEKHVDIFGKIHCSLFTAGTTTGRFSCSNPNLQNLNKEKNLTDKWLVRRAFIPWSKEFCFFMPDYDQMEYRMMLDYAGQMDIIEQVLGGMDVHQATAEKLGIGRDHAKTMNFLLIYGGGVEAIMDSLKIGEKEAKDLRGTYFAGMPKVAEFMETVKRAAKQRGYIWNWAGRIYHFEPENTYKACNYLIQGGCADVMKIGMNRAHNFLNSIQAKSGLVLSIHDEPIFCLHKDELALAPELCKIFETVYPHKYLKLTISPEHSWKSLADKVKGFPTISEQ